MSSPSSSRIRPPITSSGSTWPGRNRRLRPMPRAYHVIRPGAYAPHVQWTLPNIEATTDGRSSAGASHFDEARLIDKLRAIEALFSGATTTGEQNAAAAARDRIRARLAQLAQAGDDEQPEEFQFSLGDVWARKVFVTLLRRYGIKPYRYRRQRRTTVMARMPKRFLDDTLWPEFVELNSTLQTYLAQVTDRVVAEVLHGDSSDADIVVDPPALTLPARTSAPPADSPAPPAGNNDGAQRAKNRRKRKRKRKRRR